MTRRVGEVAEQQPAPAGPYSNAVRIGSMVATAGQTGLDPSGRSKDSFRAQAEQAFENVRACLESCGATMDDVISVRVFLTDFGYFGEMNEIFARYFSEPYPARTTVTVYLPGDMKVEVDALAVLE